MTAPVIGFDLDMTLLDTRPGIAATYQELSARTGTSVDISTVVSRLGLPLPYELENWFPPDEVAQAVQLYRQLYPEYAITRGFLLPGAADAVAAARESGGRAVVVTAKLTAFAHAHLRHVGLTVDAVTGDRYGEGKTAAIREHGAHIYVGDHVSDIQAARAAGAVAVAVATGPYAEPELAAAGADVVLPSLGEFPTWLAGP